MMPVVEIAAVVLGVLWLFPALRDNLDKWTRPIRRPIVIVYWWFTGQRRSHERYFTMMRMRRLKWDPRAVRRANMKCQVLTLLIGYAVILGVNTWIQFTYHFDPIIGPAPLMIVLPFSLVFVAHTIFTLHFAHQAIAQDAYIKTTFAIIFEIVGFIVAWAMAQLTWTANAADNSGLTTEKGNRRWVFPDELAKGRESLLPDNYDIMFGYDRAAKNRTRRRVAHRAATSQKNKAKA